MKKIVTIIIIFLFTAFVTSYAESYRNQIANSEETAGRSGALYENTSSINSEESSVNGALYKAPADDPGGRPGNGGGIGQKTPLNDGFLVLTSFCLFLVAVMILNKKQKKIIRF